MLSYEKYSRGEEQRSLWRNRGLNAVIFSCCLAGAVVLISFVLSGFKDAAAQEAYIENADEIVTAPAETAEDGTKDRVSFTALENAGSPATMWITVPGTPIDYPLVQTGDNDYYLDHDAYGNDSEAGAIFINSSNSDTLTDAKTVIFGHNMSNGSMFSCINKFVSKSYGQKHSTLSIVSADGSRRRYKLLCYIYTLPLDDAVYTIDPEEDKQEAAQALLSEAKVQYSDYTGGELVCLSTCKHHTKRSVAVYELTKYTPGVGAQGTVTVRTVPGTSVDGQD